jgi:pimeloyl-ACP methyl ester carboxylesterase
MELGKADQPGQDDPRPETCLHMPEECVHWVRSTDVRLIHAGRGTKLLFLHGAAGVPPWNQFFDALANRFEVLVPEHPGFGTDKHAESIRSIADLAMYYLDFIDALDADTIHLVGHSLGGWTAAEIAVRNCSKLASLTLIAPAGLRIKGTPAGDNFIWSSEELTRNLFYDQRLADQLLSCTVSDEEADRRLTNRFMAARLAWEPRWFNPGLARWLHRISVPALLVWGRNDKLLPSAYAEEWSRGVPRLQTTLLPDCGHLPHAEKSEETAAIILSFLERLG